MAAKHDVDAFAEFYTRHARNVRAYFVRAMGSNLYAEDLTAETFCAAFAALPAYRPSASPARSWLYAIARNRMLDQVRKNQTEAKGTVLRVAIMCRLLRGLGYAEAAATAGCSEQVMRKRVSRGLAALRALLPERPSQP